MKRYLILLRTYLFSQRFNVCILALLLLGGIGLELLSPLLLQNFIDTLQYPSSSFFIPVLLFFCFTIFNQLCTTFASYLSEAVGWRATNELRVDLTLHCLNLDMHFHKAHTPGELLERVDGDIATLSDFFSNFVFVMLGRFLLLLGIIVIAFMADWRAGLLFLIFTIFLFSLFKPIQKRGVPMFQAARQADAELASFFEERLSSLEDISGNGAQPYVMERLNRLSRRILHTARLSSVYGRLFSGALEIGAKALMAAILTLGAYLSRHGQMSLGTIYATFFYTNLLTNSLIEITFHLDGFQKALASIQRVTELHSATSAIVDGEGGLLPDGPLALRFEHVTFGYAPEKLVLHDISFELRSGRTLGILGRTGSGKTTLTRLLYRGYDVQQGTILLGNTDIRRTTRAELCARIGVVTQDVQLFQASIRENLTLFNPNISDTEIMHALAELHLTQWLAEQPHGLDTVLTEGGGMLSSGEAQLLAFARVFLHNPDIVILDEASSRLDPATERLLQQAIGRLLQGRTGIIIAHHLDTIQRVDDILILEDGHIREHGERHLLASDPTSRFSQLIQSGLTEVIA